MVNINRFLLVITGAAITLRLIEIFLFDQESSRHNFTYAQVEKKHTKNNTDNPFHSKQFPNETTLWATNATLSRGYQYDSASEELEKLYQDSLDLYHIEPDPSYDYGTDAYFKWIAENFFARAISDTEREKYAITLKYCLGYMSATEQIKPVIFYGSLIGWWRHNKQMIPWDDDFDLALFIELNELGHLVNNETFTIDVALNISFHLLSTSPNPNNSQVVFYQHGKGIKCFVNDSDVSDPVKEWRWPFIDMFPIPLSKEAQPILDPHTQVTYKYEWVFPLHESQFEGISVKVPNNPYPILGAYYDMNVCSSSIWNHKKEISLLFFRSAKKIPCSRLSSFYNFTNIDEGQILGTQEDGTVH